MTARADCIAAAGRVFRLALAEMQSLPPRQAAEAAHYAGGPSIDELEGRIRALREFTHQAA